MKALAAYHLLVADVYELAGISRSTSEVIARRQHLTAARWHVLSVISGKDVAVPGIARRLGLTRQSVQRVVDDLVDGGMAVLTTNPDHERSPLVTITDTGREVLATLFAASTAERGALLKAAGVSAADLLAARATLRALLAAFKR